MNASELVDKLLEAGLENEPISDPMQYAFDTLVPEPRSGEHIDLVKFTRALRDELVERGWRHVRLQPIEDNQWYLTAGWIDDRFRSKYAAQGWRVTPAPEDDWNLGGRVASSLKGGLSRVGCKLLSLEWPEDFQRVHDGMDLERLPDDFEDDQGDWYITAIFTFAPKPKFWKMLQNATPPDPPKPPKPEPEITLDQLKQILKRKYALNRAFKRLKPPAEDDLDNQVDWMYAMSAPAHFNTKQLMAHVKQERKRRAEWERKRQEFERKRALDPNTPFPADLM